MVRLGKTIRSGIGATRAVLPEVALGAPALILVAVMTGMLVAMALGYRPLAAPADLTLSEAAALRDSAEILRQVNHGADPNRRYIVRHGFRRNAVYTMTPLEAATANSRADVVELLVTVGARLDPPTARSLFCFAERVPAEDVSAFITAQSGGAMPADCQGIQTPW